MTTDLEARQIVERAMPELAPGVSLLVRVLSRLESHYGDYLSGNWGAIHAGPSWSGPTFPHVDKGYDPKTGEPTTYTTDFRAYATPDDAARDVYRVLLQSYPRAIDAAKDGRWNHVSEALYGYYTGTTAKSQAIATHRKALLRNLEELRAATGETATVTDHSPVASVLMATAIGGAIVGGLYLVTRFTRRLDA